MNNVYERINAVIYAGVFLVLLFLLNSTANAQVTLTATADGTQPFTYAWTNNGAPIAGALAATYSPTVSGVFGVTVLNAAGSATSAPVAVAITTATVDYSKQKFSGGIATAYSPPVAQFPIFAVVPVKKAIDPGAHWNDATSVYTVGAGEDGDYEAFILVRTVDNPPPSVGIGLTAGTDNTDVKTLWLMTPPPTPNYVHWGAEHKVSLPGLKAGAQIRFNVFVQSAITFTGYDVSITRIP